MIGPRDDFLCWDDVWMATAILFSRRSKDPHTQVGACIVGPDNRHVSLGYNGFPRDCDSDKLPWDRSGDPIDTKYLYVCHAEANAIDNGDNEKMANGKIYTTLYPCNECAKRIIQRQIKEVVYMSDKYHDADMCKAARKMFKMAGVHTRQFVPEKDELIIRLKE